MPKNYLLHHFVPTTGENSSLTKNLFKYMYRMSLVTGLLILYSISLQAQLKSINQRVDSVLHLMTLEEKIGQLNQCSGREATGPVTAEQTNLLNDIKKGLVGSMLNVKGVKDTRALQDAAMASRLQIPLLFGLDVIHGYKTIFPIPLAQAASWDLEAIRLSERTAAAEASASGIHWTFSPMVDITRDPRWGRIMEGAGEDSYLGSVIATARVQGFQGRRLGSTNDAIMACAKHFVAYGAVSAGRDYNDVEMSDHQLWETYLPPFKAAANAGVATFMTSFNTLNGIPTAANTFLQRAILKGKWNYKGFVVSDWGAIEQMVEWGYAIDKKDASLKAFESGCDMDMGDRIFLTNLPQLAREKKLNLKMLDDAVRRILTKKFELGLFDDPYRFCNEARQHEQLNDPRHVALARDVACKTMVLLKNEEGILPLKKTGQKIALLGPLVFSKRDLKGSWALNQDTSDVVSLFEGVRLKLANAGNLAYAKGTTIDGNNSDGFTEALDLAKAADVVVLALGESWNMSGESKSRMDLTLPGNQEDLFKAVYALGKPIVVVLMAGRPLIFNEIADKAASIIYAWWPGEQGGNAIADVLFGDYNPSGKLPVTFPRHVGQIPLTYDGYNTGHPLKDPKIKLYRSAYIDGGNGPRYAFGYGLSYTSFSYSNVKLDKVSISKTDSITVSFTITNSGDREGEEVVQLYIQDPVASIVQPLRKLRDFKKVKLAAGESRVITFSVNNEKLAFYDASLRWHSEPGWFNIEIGAASDDIRLKHSFLLKN